MNAVLRVSGESAPPQAPHAASGPRPTPTPHGGREMALAMANEAYHFHMDRAGEWLKTIRELEDSRDG